MMVACKLSSLDRKPVVVTITNDGDAITQGIHTIIINKLLRQAW